MENQVNIGDQNTQQIGQNPISQPMIPQEKSKLNYWMISTIVLIMILFLGGVYTLSLRSKSVENKQHLPSVTNNPLPTATTTPPLSDTTKNWKTYTNPNPKYTIKYPSGWQVDSSKAVITQDNQQLFLTIAGKGDYKFSVYMPSGWGPGVCLFKGDPPFNGPGGDEVLGDYVEIESPYYLFRRTVDPRRKDTQKGEASWSICQKERNSTEFNYFTNATVLSILEYKTPLNYDQKIIQEMDEILRTVYVDPNIAISEKRAIELVTNLPEVKEFLSKKPGYEGDVYQNRNYSVIPWESDPGVLWVIEVREERSGGQPQKNVFGTYKVRVNPEKVTKR